MKIQSHEIAMQSQHSYSRVELEAQMSFSTLFVKPAFTIAPQRLADTKEVEPQNTMGSYVSDRSRTLNEIIQNLINMLSAKNQPPPLEEEPQGLVGYSHFSLMERFEEHESLSFSTIGHIQTDKGSLDLNLNFSMSRSFAIENRIDVYSSFDPLVINLDGDIPNLGTDTFSFDLDNDGECDQISMLGSGSGFLALDKNGDGVVNRGSELFGTITGNGFGELNEYDYDNNHWIDENDTIFDKLRIWLKNDDTKEKELVGLGEIGIGAIFLDSQTSEFTFKTQTNQTLGEMKSCGIFLNEDGSCGTIAQIDLASLEDKTDKPLAQLLQA